MKLFLLALCVLAHIFGSSAVRITREQFNDIVTNAGYPTPPGDIYPNFADATQNYSMDEITILITQLIHESDGFRYKEEKACMSGDHCAGKYVDKVGLPGKNYYGRGYFMIRYGANYKAASQGIGMGDELLKNPEQVANHTPVAVRVSIWVWETKVKAQVRGRENQFGAYTKALNGAIKCSGGWNQQAANRYQIYLKVANALGVSNKASESGCYN